MDCSQAEPLLNAYIDGELSLTESTSVETHLQSCSTCGAEAARLRALSLAIKQVAARKAPASLRSAWEGPRAAAGPTPTIPPPKPSRRPLWLVAAAACLVLGFFLGRIPARSGLAEELVASHVRSLIGTHLIDVVSSDRHTVKPWFAGKVDFSATPYDLTAEGFPLKGGRLDYVDGRPTPVFVYGRRLHVVNLYLLPGRVSVPASELRGYHVVPWQERDFTCVAVSDVATEDLTAFQRAFEAKDR